MPVTAEPTEYRRETLTEEETGPQKGLRDLPEVTQLGSCRTGRASSSRVSPSLALSLLSRPQHSSSTRPPIAVFLPTSAPEAPRVVLNTSQQRPRGHWKMKIIKCTENTSERMSSVSALVSGEANPHDRCGARRTGRQRRDPFLRRPEPNLGLSAAAPLHILWSLFNQVTGGGICSAILGHNWLPLVSLSEVGRLPDLARLGFLIGKPGHAHLLALPEKHSSCARC